MKKEVKLAIAQINPILGDLQHNASLILNYAREAVNLQADLLLTPELALTGYPPEDLLLREGFYEASASCLEQLAGALAEFPDLTVVVGHPWQEQGCSYNAASVLRGGQLLTRYFKQCLPNDQVFDEKRYFQAGQHPCVFELHGIRFALAICEDTWYADVPAQARAAGAEVLLIPNGSPYHMGKQAQRFEVVRQHVCALGMTAVYANLLGGQDELVFDGNSFVMNPAGDVECQLPHCEPALLCHDITLSGPAQAGSLPVAASVEQEIYQALVLGVRDYVQKNNFPGVLLGLSGGVDSALTLAIAVDALGADKVRAVMMPSPYTAEISWLDSREMVARLGVRYDEIPIVDCFNAFRQTLSAEFAGLAEDTTEENIQARIRGTIMMALSNKYGSIVLTTGNKSEMAVGYCTLYGDMAGGFAVIKDIAKTLVYKICAWRNSQSAVIPERILTRAPSAELRPDQTDQDSLPPYEVLDGIMALYMEQNKSRAEIIAAGYQAADVEKITRLIKINEYKRRQAPVGIRITPRAFGRDWRYPITSRFRD